MASKPTSTDRMKLINKKLNSMISDKKLPNLKNTNSRNPTLLKPSIPLPNMTNSIYKEALNKAQSALRLKDSEIFRLKKEVEELKKQIQAKDSSEIEELYQNLQKDYSELNIKYNKLNSKIEASYTSEDLAESFNLTIDSFNDAMNDTEGDFTYMINSMDVDLKAQIIKENKELRFLTDPSSNSDASISTIKISMQAVPK